MTTVAIHIGENPDLETFLAERIHEFNAAATGYHDAESFAASSRNDSGGIDAGIAGFTRRRAFTLAEGTNRSRG